MTEPALLLQEQPVPSWNDLPAEEQEHVLAFFRALIAADQDQYGKTQEEQSAISA